MHKCFDKHVKHLSTEYFRTNAFTLCSVSRLTCHFNKGRTCNKRLNELCVYRLPSKTKYFE